MELMQYNPSVDLHAAITLQLEFLGAGQAVTTVTISPFPLLRLSSGVTLQLLMMVSVALPFQSLHRGAWVDQTKPSADWARARCKQSRLPLGIATLPQVHWMWSGELCCCDRKEEDRVLERKAWEDLQKCTAGVGLQNLAQYVGLLLS